MSAPRAGRLAAVLLIMLLSSGCVKTGLEDEVVFRADGSGRARITFRMSRDDLRAIGMSGATQQGVKEPLPPRATLSTRSDEHWLYWDVALSFQNPRQLHEDLNLVLRAFGKTEHGDSVWTVTVLDFSRERGLLRTVIHYTAELKTAFTADAAVLAPSFLGWTHTVVLPGRVEHTNGTVRGNRITWKVGSNQTLRATVTTTVRNTATIGLLGLLLLLVVGGGIVMGVRRRRAHVTRWCEQCGAALPAGARFCEHCGWEVGA
jgi:hypothetical protein